MEQETHSDSSRKGGWKISLFLFGAVLFSGALYAVWLFLQRPAVGVIRTGTLPVKDEGFDQGNEQKYFRGAHFSFSYPGTYAEKSHSLPASGPIKETLFLLATDLEGRKIAVTVEERVGGGLEASPSFQMRASDPQTYERTSMKKSGLDTVLFTKNSPVFEQTAFFQKNDLVVSIAVTSSFSPDALLGDLDDIFQDFEWK
ncbi:MAG: hypothetical protein WA082_02150 [Candidatus Moraniibacteriota bacterium]